MSSIVTNTVQEIEENENELQDDEIEPDLVVLDPNHVRLFSLFQTPYLYKYIQYYNIYKYYI